MKAEIITIGDEILLGHVVDTNAAYIADQISSVGVDLARIITVGDGDRRIIEALKESLKRSDLVITTGGLGPTDDDLTKLALCHAFDTKLVFNQKLMDLIDRRYRRRGLKMPELVRDQGEQPEGATLFPNPIGSAVGILMERDGKRTISLPGVPQEMRAIMEQSVIPYIQNLHHGYNVIFRKIQTFGTFEAYITDMLKEHEFRHDGVELAYLPSLKGVVVRLTYRGRDREAGQSLLDQYSGRLKKILGDYHVSDDGRDLVETTARLLTEKRKTVSTAESCTGGMISSALTDLSGSSAYFTQSAVTYSNEAKMKVLAVPEQVLVDHGAVSEETVRCMAEGMRRLAGTDYALAVSGIAGPTGGTGDKPVGLIYIGLADEDGAEVWRHVFGKDRDINRRRTVYHALNHLRMKLLKG